MQVIRGERQGEHYSKESEKSMGTKPHRGWRQRASLELGGIHRLFVTEEVLELATANPEGWN